MDSKLAFSKYVIKGGRDCSYRTTEKRREEIAAPQIVARMRVLSRAWTLSEVCFGILVRKSILSPGLLPSIQANSKKAARFVMCCSSTSLLFLSLPPLAFSHSFRRGAFQTGPASCCLHNTSNNLLKAQHTPSAFIRPSPTTPPSPFFIFHVPPRVDSIDSIGAQLINQSIPQLYYQLSPLQRCSEQQSGQRRQQHPL
jgi:hypothetical protein